MILIKSLIVPCVISEARDWFTISRKTHPHQMLHHLSTPTSRNPGRGWNMTQGVGGVWAEKRTFKLSTKCYNSLNHEHHFQPMKTGFNFKTIESISTRTIVVKYPPLARWLVMHFPVLACIYDTWRYTHTPLHASDRMQTAAHFRGLSGPLAFHFPISCLLTPSELNGPHICASRRSLQLHIHTILSATVRLRQPNLSPTSTVCRCL